MNENLKVYMRIFFGLIIVLAVLLFWEYRFFYVQSKKMIALQQEYYAYTEVVKRIIRKHKLSDESRVDAQTLCSIDNSLFPQGVKIFSSEENDNNGGDILPLINREPAYLKKSAIAYFKEQQLDSLMSAIYGYEWQDYSDQVLTKRRPEQKFSSQEKSIEKKSFIKDYGKWSAYGEQRNKNQLAPFIWPIERESFWLSSFFGPRKKPNGSWGFHYGIDMAAIRGTPVKAAASGVVEQAGYVTGYGNTVVIGHDNMRKKTRYAHLDTIDVKPKQKIEQGKILGTVGDTGYTIKSGKDASHLHFEVYEQNKQINPLYWLPA